MTWNIPYDTTKIIVALKFKRELLGIGVICSKRLLIGIYGKNGLKSGFVSISHWKMFRWSNGSNFFWMAPLSVILKENANFLCSEKSLTMEDPVESIYNTGNFILWVYILEFNVILKHMNFWARVSKSGFSD